MVPHKGFRSRFHIKVKRFHIKVPDTGQTYRFKGFRKIVLYLDVKVWNLKVPPAVFEAPDRGSKWCFWFMFRTLLWIEGSVFGVLCLYWNSLRLLGFSQVFFDYVVMLYFAMPWGLYLCPDNLALRLACCIGGCSIVPTVGVEWQLGWGASKVWKVSYCRAAWVELLIFMFRRMDLQSLVGVIHCWCKALCEFWGVRAFNKNTCCGIFPGIGDATLGWQEELATSWILCRCFSRALAWPLGTICFVLA